MLAHFLERRLDSLHKEELVHLLQELKKFCDEKMLKSSSDIQESILTLLENRGLNLVSFRNVFLDWKAYRQKYGFISSFDIPKEIPQTKTLFIPYIAENCKSRRFPYVEHLQTNALCLRPYTFIKLFPKVRTLTSLWIDCIWEKIHDLANDEAELKTIHYWTWENWNWEVFHRGGNDTLRLDLETQIYYPLPNQEELPEIAFLRNGSLALEPSLMPILFKKEN